MADPGAASPAPPPAPPAVRRRRWLAWALGSLAVLLALLLAAGGGAWWTLTNERGTTWLLSRLPGVEVRNPRGSVLGDFGADEIVWRFGEGGELRLQQLSWQRLAVSRTAVPGAWLHVAFDRLQAREARLTMPRREQTNRTPPPTELRLPVELQVGALHIDTLHASPLGELPLRGLQAGVHLGADGGRLHRIDALKLSRGPLVAEGALRVGALAPMASDIRIRLHQPAGETGPAWNADLHLQGPLAAAQLTGRLVAAAATPQTLDLRATVQPFAQWPLGTLDARADSLDVSALLAGGPRTALSGSIVLQAADKEKPLRAQADLVNREAGAWSAGQLPVRRVRLEVNADARDPHRVVLRRLNAELGTAAHAAGSVAGQGTWSTTAGWALTLGLEDVRPDLLDARVLPMVLQGPVRLSGRDEKPATGNLPPRRSASAQAELDGELLGPPRRKLTLHTSAQLATTPEGAFSVELQRLEAAVPPSRATLQGRLQRAAAGAPLTTRGQLQLAGFDPAPWMPLQSGAFLRRAENRLNARSDFDIALPAAGPAGDLLAWLAALRGTLALQLDDSRLAGVPLSGQARFEGRDAEGLQARLGLQAAGNRVDAQAVLAPDARRDHAQARLQAPALARLQPLARALVPAGRRPPAVSGSASGSLVLDGRWPQLQTRGELVAQNVVWPGLRLRRADARWQLGTGARAPFNARVTVADLGLAGSERARQVPLLEFTADGTADAHRLALAARLAAAPPAWADTLQPAGAPRAPTGPGTRVLLRANGGFLHEAGQPAAQASGWRGRIDTADLRRTDGAQPLLRAGPVDLAWRNASSGSPMRVDVQPGRAELMGGALSWRRLSWQAAAAGKPMQADVDASLAPMQVAPLLARLQPAFGWSGDLAVGGRVVLRTAPALHADVLLQRAQGDLQMVQGSQRRALGLSTLRLAARAEGTTWRANAAVAGRSIGDAQADVTARTSAASPWPDAGTPLQGRVQLRVADLGIYSAWLPVGWRIGGQLAADARLGGLLGAPTYSGRVRGSQLAVGNFVQGVRVRDGELAASLDGERGRIEHFVARAGDGQVRIEGAAAFGAQPTAELALVAQRFRVLGRVDRQVDLSGQARARLDTQGIAVQGRLRVDEGLVDLGRGEAPELSKDVRVVDAATPGRPAVGASGTAASPKRALKLDVTVDLGDKLRVRGKGINTLLAGAVHVTSPGGQPALEGTVRTVQGSYEAYGEKLRIERGLITFVGPVANPRLDIRAMRPDLRDLEVGVAITGTAQNPRVALYSTPEMSELDKLSWLTLGRSGAGLASDQSAILQRAALALLAGQRGSGGGEGLAKRVGLDKVSFQRGESGGLSDAVVTLGKQISERFYMGYSQSLDATGGSWELLYKVARRLTVRVQTGDETAFDVIWTWLWG